MSEKGEKGWWGGALEYADISDMEVLEGEACSMLLLSDVIVGEAERRRVGTNQNNEEKVQNTAF